MIVSVLNTQACMAAERKTRSCVLGPMTKMWILLSVSLAVQHGRAVPYKIFLADSKYPLEVPRIDHPEAPLDILTRYSSRA